MAISDEGKRSWSRAGARAVEVGSRWPTAEEAERTQKEKKERNIKQFVGGAGEYYYRVTQKNSENLLLT